jgi:hypothetical protein
MHGTVYEIGVRGASAADGARWRRDLALLDRDATRVHLTEIQKIKISARFALTVTAPAASGSAIVRESVRLAVRQVC